MRARTSLAHFDGVGAGQLIDRHDGRGLAVETAREVVGLRAELDAGHVLEVQHRAVGIGAQDDVAEVLGRNQPALRAHGIGKLLAAGTGSPPICPAGLTLFCVCSAVTICGTVTPSLASWSGLTQTRSAYWPAPKTCTRETPVDAGNVVHQIDVGVIREESAIVGGVRRRDSQQHQRRAQRLLHRQPAVLTCAGTGSAPVKRAAAKESGRCRSW